MLALQHNLYIWRFHPLGPQVASGSWAVSGFAMIRYLHFTSRQWYDPAPPGRVIPNSYIPNTIAGVSVTGRGTKS